MGTQATTPKPASMAVRDALGITSMKHEELKTLAELIRGNYSDLASPQMAERLANGYVKLSEENEKLKELVAGFKKEGERAASNPLPDAIHIPSRKTVLFKKGQKSFYIKCDTCNIGSPIVFEQPEYMCGQCGRIHALRWSRSWE